MKRFKNILVGVDLSHGDHFVAKELPSITVEAIERAMWLAKLNSARLKFLYALDVSAHAQRLIEEECAGGPCVLTDAQQMLYRVAEYARAQGIAADYEVCFGSGWLEIIRNVLQAGHDLVIVGAHQGTLLQDFLFGNTGLKLLRKCPCPVWVTRPQSDPRIRSILVAHCLREVGDAALRFGCSMAELFNAEVHVVHALEGATWHLSNPPGAADRVDNSAWTNATAYIQDQLTNYSLHVPATVHVVNESAAAALLQYIEKHRIELLVMGTIARCGAAGVITGNTAETLLQQAACSLFVVKPQGFVSPVSL